MPVITLTSDWNQDDYYCGAVKGQILSGCPEATIVDISHNIQPFNTARAAFVLKNSYHYFPAGTVHTIWVNSESGKPPVFIAALYDGHYFVGADNGLFGLLFRREPDAIVRLESGPAESSFSSLKPFCRASCHLAKGKEINELGEEAGEYVKSTPRRATIDENIITGSVIYIDSYRNAITNISRDLFERVGKGRPFEILVQSNHYRIKRLGKIYDTTPPGEMLALFNSLNLMEIAMNKGDLADLLNLDTNSSVRVKFRDRQ